MLFESQANLDVACRRLRILLDNLATGVLATLRDAFAPVATALNFYNPSGPLSGVTTVAVVIWLAVWFVLARQWRDKNVELGKGNIAAFALLAAGLLLTFPPFMDLLQGK